MQISGSSPEKVDWNVKMYNFCLVGKGKLSILAS